MSRPRTTSVLKRVAIVCNMYPTEESPHAGIFIKREVEALRRLHPDTDFRVWFIDTVGDKWRYLTGRAAVLRSIRQWSPSIIHCHYGFTPWFAPLHCAPVVCTYHGTDLASRWKRVVSWILSSRIDRSIVVSDSLQPLAQRGGPAAVIPCGVDPIFTSPCGADDGLSPAQCTLTILFPSTPERKVKDFPLFARVIDVLRDRGFSVEYITLDHVAPQDVVDRMCSSDILLMTSITEGSPVTVREALCCGCRVVSTQVGDVRKWLSQFSGCRTVEDRSAEALADACVAVMQEAGPDAEAAASLFSVDSEAIAVAQIYSSLLLRPNRT